MYVSIYLSINVLIRTYKSIFAACISSSEVEGGSRWAVKTRQEGYSRVDQTGRLVNLRVDRD